jgi:hypothetical protein
MIVVAPSSFASSAAPSCWASAGELTKPNAIRAVDANSFEKEELAAVLARPPSLNLVIKTLPVASIPFDFISGTAVCLRDRYYLHAQSYRRGGGGQLTK